MDPRTAWIAAAVTGALAVGIVSVDLAMNLTFTLESERDGAWQTVARARGDDYSYPEPFPAFGCASDHLRITADNGLPWGTDVEVRITVSWYNQTGEPPQGKQESQTLYHDTWHLDRGEVRRHEFTVPGAAGTQSTHVDVWVDGRALGTCVEVR